MHVTPMQIEVVDHGTDAHPVDDIAQCTADHADVGDRLESVANAAPEEDCQRCADGDTERTDCMPLPAACVGQKGERGARIEDMDQIEPGGDGNNFASGQVRGHHPFDELVQRKQQDSGTHLAPPEPVPDSPRGAWCGETGRCVRHRSWDSINGMGLRARRSIEEISQERLALVTAGVAVVMPRAVTSVAVLGRR